MNKKGQSILAEYVMIFFVAVAALVAMTLLVQRSFQARIHDARNYMTESVTNTGACDANCLAAAGITGNSIPHEYEPYYAQMLSDVQQNDIDNASIRQGNPQSIGAIYSKSVNHTTDTVSSSAQLPSGCANGANVIPCN